MRDFASRGNVVLLPVTATLPGASVVWRDALGQAVTGGGDGRTRPDAALRAAAGAGGDARAGRVGLSRSARRRGGDAGLAAGAKRRRRTMPRLRAGSRRRRKRRGSICDRGWQWRSRWCCWSSAGSRRGGRG
ncbi:hypothetical protein AB5I41_12035 [Sphingomonas sp. MMS24-JH45]